MSYAEGKIEGFTTRDAIIRATKTGKFITSFSVAVSFGEGENKKVSFFDVETWDKREDITKGTLVKCTGYLSQETWEDKSGNKRSKIKLTAKTVEIVRPASNSQPTDAEHKLQEAGLVEKTGEHFDDTRIPF